MPKVYACMELFHRIFGFFGKKIDMLKNFKEKLLGISCDLFS